MPKKPMHPRPTLKIISIGGAIEKQNLFLTVDSGKQNFGDFVLIFAQ